MVEMSKSLSLPYSGQSMYPFLRSGSLLDCEIYDTPKDPINMKEGSIYLVKDSEEWIFHRCIYHQGELVLKGDWSTHYHGADVLWGHVVLTASQEKKSRRISKISSGTISSSRIKRYMTRLILLCI